MKQSKDSEELTRVGAGTVMGKFMREYWIPAAKSSEIANDGTPMRLQLLGEKLVAFRDSSGRAGVLDHQCPHRCASLVLGRNEENGLRCIYHGWKFDVNGNCVDMPSVPAARTSRKRSRPRRTRRRTATAFSGSTWASARTRRRCPWWRPHCWKKKTWTSPS